MIAEIFFLLEKCSKGMTEHRNPSKYAEEERRMLHFLKRGRKLINAGVLEEPRLNMFKEILELSEQYKRKNQNV